MPPEFTKPLGGRSCANFKSWVSILGGAGSTTTSQSVRFAPAKARSSRSSSRRGRASRNSHGPKVRAAGRIVLQRKTGKLIFLDIRDWTGQIQVMIGRNQVGDQNWAIAECFDLGDLIGVEGEFKRTQNGELTIFAEKLFFLTKSIEPHPEKHHGLSDPELRQRMRYLDLIYTDGVLPRFLNRTKIVHRSAKRSPARALSKSKGRHCTRSPAARRRGRFMTHHNALDMPLYLRIALELHLKRLLVGGIERVYELGRVYRNEGISPRHNPEFTMLEVYQAYGDYRSMMDLSEKLIVDAIHATGQPLELPWGETTVDFTPPFARKTYDELFAEHTGLSPTDEAGIQKLAEEIGFDTAGKHPDVIKSEVFEERVEDRLVGPVFVMDYPASICPLTKRKTSNPAVAERFELFVQGMEVANAYTELNDPDLQEQLFRTQLAGQKEEDSMAKMDHDFHARHAARHAAGRRHGNRHRSTGDAAHQQPNHPRRDPVPAAAAGVEETEPAEREKLECAAERLLAA